MKYKALYGHEFAFNDKVKCVTLSMMQQRDVVGRLVQVRLGTGQFGSDLYFLRLPDGGLMTAENEMLRPYEGDIECPVMASDSEEIEYTINNEWPATGFLIVGCQKPQTPGHFSMAITGLELKD